ncbi:MAG: FAD/NAD(P)-binding protein [Novosphingobium sp.]
MAEVVAPRPAAVRRAVLHVVPPFARPGPALARHEHVAIVGAGFSGTLLAINLLRHGGPRVTLIERRLAFARGVAFAAGQPGHLLNVRAANMSALPDQPAHFAEWLAREGRGVGATFATRHEYGRYLAGLLHETVVDSGGRLVMRQGDVRGLAWNGDRATLTLDDGPAVRADAVVLALGNLPPDDPPGFAAAGLAEETYVPDPWTVDPGRGLKADDTVVVLGTGLTMVDLAVALDDSGFGGRIVAVSRRGLLPRAHASEAPGATAPLPEVPRETGAALLRRVRNLAGEVGWRAAVDALRPHTQALWMGAPEAARGRFLRHLRPWWDVHRHRLAPEVAERLQALLAEGRLEIVRAGLTRVTRSRHGVAVELTLRRSGEVRRLDAARIVNCTGPQGDLLRSREPLFQRLLDEGAIRPGRHGFGIDVNAHSETIDAHGMANPRLLALGPLTRGTFWEIVAVPDIRVQAWSVARRMCHAEGFKAARPA